MTPRLTARPHPFAAATAVLAALVTAACSGAAHADRSGGSPSTSTTAAVTSVAPPGITSSPAPPSSPTVDVAVDHAYLSTRVTEAGRDHPLVTGTAVRLVFGPHRITADAGCNHLTGTTRRTGDHIAPVDSLISTAMACPPEKMQQDRWLMNLIQQGLDLSGTSAILTVTGSGVTIRLAPVPLPTTP